MARKALATAAGDGLAGLTARETQVLRLIADGATTREVSEQLFISAKTADNHIQHIYTKLGVTNRAARHPLGARPRRPRSRRRRRG